VKFLKSFLPTLCLLFIGLQTGRVVAESLQSEFTKPPPEARPWVYWFWLNGNITSNGITADLEAMKRVGIGGVLIMEVDQGAPVGPVDFMSPRWRDLFRHVHSEARRLGLEVNMNNDAGWNGSGGPWIKPELSMQEVVWSELEIHGPQSFKGQLPQPETRANYYRDIAVMAFPTVNEFRLPNIETKAAFQNRGSFKPAKTNLAAPKVIERGSITNLTAQTDAAGNLVWTVPPGDWTVIRFGHTSTGVENSPAPASGRGLECDKLSKAGIEAQFEQMMAKLAADTGIGPGHGKGGLVATHIDSWENGSQNWTARMREEFQLRRHYDLLPYLPAMTGRVIGSSEISERFLWDLRQTISELVVENYAGRMRELAHNAGLRFTVEAYGSPCDAIPYAGQADEPMGEFWTPSGAIETCRGMASAGHVYGQRIIGAEAFTSGDRERWLEHPAILKSHGDRAFCEGINRFVVHRYAMQPWTDDRNPGMTMGPWGQHYERTQTWWEWTPAWHTYLARCQHLLRQGWFVADICRVQSEAPAQGFSYHDRHGYDWDECDAEVVLRRMSVKDGRIVLPDGMSYRILVLPWSQTITPRLLQKVKQLVQAGATVLGPKPNASPSLSEYPQCDNEVKRIAGELWGEADGATVKEHRFGLGRVVWSDSPEKVLQDSGIAADFTSTQPLRYLHRTTKSAEIYFVANLQPYEVTATCGFRVAGRVPELWWPDSGRIERATMWSEQAGVTQVVIPFTTSGSVFVMFREASRKKDSVLSLRRNGIEILSAAPKPPPRVRIIQARYGLLDDPTRTRNVTEKVQARADNHDCDFLAVRMADGDDPAPGKLKTLAVDYEIEGRQFQVKALDSASIHLTRNPLRIRVDKARYGVLDDPKRTRDLRQKVQELVDAGATSFPVALLAQGDDPAFLVVKTLALDYTQDDKPHHLTATDPETVDLAPATAPPRPPATLRRDPNGRVYLVAQESGDYEWTTTSGKVLQRRIADVSPALDLIGQWQVRFGSSREAGFECTFENLGSWSTHSNTSVKFFSGEATCTKTVMVPKGLLGKDRRLSLDLGRVATMAEIKWNGKNLGTIWKPPFVVDITGVAKAGANKLEVKVVNLWPNRMIGDEQLAEDSERNDNGTLKQWPKWLLDGKPSPAGRHTFTSWRLWKKDEPLLESGLLGPVKVVISPQLAIP